MSPEQVRGASSVDHRTDLYALGVCFFNMLTGRYAFDGDTFGNILISICTEPLPDLKQAAPFVSDAVAAWFERCCARTPEARFQSADELIEQLQIAVGGDMPLLLRANPPQDFRGPSGTIRGHAAPLGPQTRAISTDGSGSFLAQQQAPARPEAATRSSTDSAPSVLTVHEAKSQSATYSLGVKRTAAGAFALLAALAAAFMLRTRAPVAAPPAVSINARTSALAATPGLATAAPPPKAIEAPSLPPAEAPSAPATSAPVTSSAPPSQAKPRPAPGAAPRSAPRVRAKSRGSSTDLGF
jgi:serine/threonine-protein kinase